MTVTVVVPVRNDAIGLPGAVHSILGQSGVNLREVLLVVGPSADNSETVAAELASRFPPVSVIDNPDGGIPQALNAGLAVATGEIYVRVDAHSELPESYIASALETMTSTGAVNVTAVQVPMGRHSTQRAIAAAMSHRLGSGGAAYREGRTRRRVETGFLGVYETAALRAVGGWDERFARNEDAELNLRLSRCLKREIWLDPRLRVAYSPRATLAELARQYWAYGRWRQQTVRRHRRSIAPRQLIPVVAVIILVLALAGAAIATPWLLLIPGAYLLVLLGASMTFQQLNVRERLVAAAALATMHVSWGCGFIASWLIPPRSSR